MSTIADNFTATHMGSSAPGRPLHSVGFFLVLENVEKYVKDHKENTDDVLTLVQRTHIIRSKETRRN